MRARRQADRVLSPSATEPVPVSAHSGDARSRKSKVPLLSDLREPPLIGRFYMVPAVRHDWLGIYAYWPVLGPLHDDARFFNFDLVHYHVDARFVSRRVVERALGLPPAQSSQRYPLSKRNDPHAMEVPKGRPTLKRFKCRTADFPYHYGDMRAVDTLRRHYGDVGGAVPDAIFRTDGRKLCPHRKVDLSQFRANADGIVTCPLHGLRVKCFRDSDGPRMAETASQARGEAGPARADEGGIAQ